MNSHLFQRALGNITPQDFQHLSCTELLHALHPAPKIIFDGRPEESQRNHPLTKQQSSTTRGYLPNDHDDKIWAHWNGVNCVTLDRFEGRYLLSGGAESSILLWDLEKAENAKKACRHQPVARWKKSHNYGVTHLSFYPFDSLAFLSSSYDHTLKIFATETFTPSASFDLDTVVYSHALSPIAHHLLVACATGLPVVRLVDLRSGARAHSLSGHHGAVISVAWSPRDDHILASGGSDGTVRLWDVRRSAGSIGLLDLEDFVGNTGGGGLGMNRPSREQAKAHIGVCNGVVWTEDGRYLVTAGHDERIRVWDMEKRANTLSHFGPTIKNSRLATLLPVLAPSSMIPAGTQLLFYPNEKEILMFDLFEGTLLKRLRIHAAQSRTSQSRNNRVTSLCFRNGDVELHSAHGDGLIRAWKPRTKGEIELEKAVEYEGRDEEAESRKRKRQVLNDIHLELTRTKITFT